MPQQLHAMPGRRAAAAGIAFLIGVGLIISPVQAAEITVSSEKPKQGQPLEVVVRGPANPGDVEFNNHKYRLFLTEKKAVYRALIGIPADLEPGNYVLKAGSDTKTLAVASGQFPVQRLRLPKSKDNFDMSPGEKEAIKAAKDTVSDDRMWNGPFVPPSKARTSSQFGMRRIVNGRLLKDYFHSGLDFAGALGSPVSATAPGTVVLAVNGFKLHGNCVAIDHGQGVISFYIHLSKVLVKKGDVVKAGDLIGKVGQTGRASGPHLHFSIYVNQVATNPVDWFKTVW